MVKLRALVLATLLLGFLPSFAAAYEGNGNVQTNPNQARTGGRGTQISLTSGRSTVKVTPPSGTQQTAVKCTTKADAWADAISPSRWVGTQADCTDGDLALGTYTYTTTFKLTTKGESIKLSGEVLADDTVVVKLNDTTVLDKSASGAFASSTTFETSDTDLFKTGTNTLTFTVYNVAAGSTGLDFTAAVTNGSTTSTDDEFTPSEGEQVDQPGDWGQGGGPGGPGSPGQGIDNRGNDDQGYPAPVTPNQRRRSGGR